MTFQFLCSKCGNILHEEKKPRLFSGFGRHTGPSYLEKIRKLIGASCPKCQHKLAFPPPNITITSHKKERELNVGT